MMRNSLAMLVIGAVTRHRHSLSFVNQTIEPVNQLQLSTTDCVRCCCCFFCVLLLKLLNVFCPLLRSDTATNAITMVTKFRDSLDDIGGVELEYRSGWNCLQQSLWMWWGGFSDNHHRTAVIITSSFFHSSLLCNRTTADPLIGHFADVFWSHHLMQSLQSPISAPLRAISGDVMSCAHCFVAFSSVPDVHLIFFRSTPEHQSFLV